MKQGTKKAKGKTSDVICEARLQLLDLMEELGSAACLLREAYSDFENGSPGAFACVDDAIEIMGTIERKASQIAADLAKWRTW